MESIAKELAEIVISVSTKLAQMDDAQASARPAANEWSRKEIVGHLIDSATNNHQRFVRAQIGETLDFPGYDQEGWVARQAYNDGSWNQLIEFWKAYNLHLCWVIRNIPAEAHARVCKIGDNPPVTLEGLVQGYLRHIRAHLVQLRLENSRG